jgi:pyruvate/2-oxoglutarate dehydrogenase complex dihydrolipoamide acyltransferase (E2) component
VEEEADIEKFKDYKPSSSAEPVAPAEPEAQPEQPKVEEKAPSKTPEPKAPKNEDTSQSGDRIFASPLARKLAEDNNVSTCCSAVLILQMNCSGNQIVFLDTGPTVKCERYRS